MGIENLGIQYTKSGITTSQYILIGGVYYWQ